MAANDLKKVAFGGYDKQSVIVYIDMINARIHKLEGFKQDGGDAFTLTPLKYPEEVLKKAAIGGYDIKETDALVAELTEKVKKLERELNIRS